MKKIEQNNTRATYRLQRLNETTLFKEIEAWTDSKDYNYYLGYGGIGDAFLLLASCWDDPNARIVFFGNNNQITKELFDLFDLDVFFHDNILFSPLGKKIYHHVTNKPTFKTSAHLPDNLNHGDWVNWQKYKDRLVKSTPWRSLIGNYTNPFDTKGTVCVCPSGSQRDTARQRYLTDYEYRKLIGSLLLKNYTVITVDSPEHLRLYPKIGHKHALRCCSSYLEFNDGEKESIDLSRMLQVINSSIFCVSVDSWMVAYCNLVNIFIKVVQTRWNGVYKPLNTHGDFIFMNKEIWPNMELFKAEEICY